MTRLRLVIIGTFPVLLTAVGYAYWTRGERTSDGTYVTETVARDAVVSTVTATGTVNPVTTVQVGTYVSGPIKAIYVDYNSPVKQGELVAKIDPRPFVVKVQAAEANLANARAKVQKDRADLELKKLTLNRNRELLARSLVSQNDVDTATSNYDQAAAQLALDEAGVQQAQASLQEARINLEYTDITSPVEGVVVSRNVDVGHTVAASLQTPTLFLIAQDLTKMQVDTNVSESDIGEVRKGQPASFTVDAYPGNEFHGTVAQVRNAPITVQNVVTYDVVIAVDNLELKLKPGMTATVNIITAERTNVLRIPLRALRFHPEPKPSRMPQTSGAQRAPVGEAPPAVWVLQADGALRKVAVTLGVRNDQYAEILSADLHDGDQVAVAFRQGARRSNAKVPSFAHRRF
jgi:HlyD family secretion protein